MNDLCKNSSLKLFIAWAHYASKILYWNYLLSMSLQSCPCYFNSCLRFLFNSFHINNFTCVATYYCDFNYWIPIKIIVLLLQIHLKFYINDSLKNEQFTNSHTWTVSWEGNDNRCDQRDIWWWTKTYLYFCFTSLKVNTGK